MSLRRELKMMLQAARLYYEDGLTQRQVADELGVSRPRVSRLLTGARAEGIVRIRIVDPFTTFDELGDRLVEAFGLEQAVITAGEGLSGGSLRRHIGLAAAEYLRNVLNDDLKVGIGWGRTLLAVIEALDIERRVGIHVFPLIGGLSQGAAAFQVNDLARRMAEAFGGNWQALYAPAFVTDLEAQDILLRHPDVRKAVESWDNLDMAVVGIGHSALQHHSSMFFGEYMGESLSQRLEEWNAVGDVCGRFFDIEGKQCCLEAGVIGISLEQLKMLNRVVGIAGGEEKAAAILSALRGSYVNVLITDTVTARAVLEMHESGG
jgi:deoxyribonucleoside regulator